MARGEKEKRGRKGRTEKRLVATSEKLSLRKKEDDEGAYENVATQRAHVSPHVFRISSARNATDENRHGAAWRRSVGSPLLFYTLRTKSTVVRSCDAAYYFEREYRTGRKIFVDCWL